MKLVGTRIREEKSEHKEEYFPEYCLEWSPWYKFGFGKPKQKWYGVSIESSHFFGEARQLCDHRYLLRTLMWAQAIIDKQVSIMDKSSKEHHHDSTKQTSYIKYP